MRHCRYGRNTGSDRFVKADGYIKVHICCYHQSFPRTSRIHCLLTFLLFHFFNIGINCTNCETRDETRQQSVSKAWIAHKIRCITASNMKVAVRRNQAMPLQAW